jgi:hypothetical protein
MAHADRITIDEFEKLGPAEHSVAIHTYSQRITQLQKRLQQPGTEDAREIISDELGRCLSLRKVHVLALAELLDVVPTRAAA